MIDNCINYGKERAPEETVAIIKRFFTENFPTLTLIVDYKRENAGMFWHSLKLYDGNKLLMFSNGKGMKEEYSLASAYAEMYERFCCKNTEGEVVASPSVLSESSYAMFPFVEKEVLDDCHNYIDRMGITGSKEFIGVHNNEIRHLNPFLKYMLDGTTGMAAGNTLEEALNQAVSETAERYVQKLCYYEECVPAIINEETLKKYATNAFNKIEQLKKKNINVKVYDFSLSTGLPVVCSLLVDTKRFVHKFVFGSFPVFNIAVERTLTEAFQGEEIEMLDYLYCEPFLGRNDDEESMLGVDGNTHYPEELFINAKTINFVNENVYMHAAENNKIFQFLKEVLVKKGYDVYYCDLSLCDDMKAVYVHIPNMVKNIGRYETSHSDMVLDTIDELIENIKENSLSLNNAKKYLHVLSNSTPLEATYLNEKFDREWAYHYIMSVLLYILGDYENALDEIAVINERVFSEEEALGLFRIFLINAIDGRNIWHALKLWGIDEKKMELLYEDISATHRFLLQDVFCNKGKWDATKETISKIRQNKRKGIS